MTWAPAVFARSAIVAVGSHGAQQKRGTFLGRIMTHDNDQSCGLHSAFLQLQLSPTFLAYPLEVRAAFGRVAAWLPSREAFFQIIAVDASFAKRLRDKAARERGYRFGNYALLMLQAIIRAAIDSGALSSNRIAQVPRLLPPRQHSAQRRSIRPIRHRLSARAGSGRKKSTA